MNQSMAGKVQLTFKMGCCSSNAKVRKPEKLPKPEPNSEVASKVARKMGEGQGKPLQEQGIQIQERLDTPLLTEGDNVRGQTPEKDIINNSKRATSQKKKPKTYHYFDISPKIAKKHKIYQISNTYPVTKPYSTLQEWQIEFKKIFPKQMPSNRDPKLPIKVPMLSEEEIATKVLLFKNRNWIQELIKLNIDINDLSGAASLDSFVTYRRAIQIREHFNWLVWSVGQFYFSQKAWDNKQIALPRPNTKKWTDGFEYLGVHFKVMPYEDSYYVQNEIFALKQVQMELMELDSLANQIQQQYGQIKEKLHKDVILPLIAGVSCGGFFLYGSPVIYTQELDQNKSFFKDSTVNASKIGGLQNSVVYQQQQQQNQSQYNSVQMQAIQNQSNMSFSYLHNNISPDFIQDSLFKFMPLLKNIGTKSMIPVIDFEEYNSKGEEFKTNVELKYLLLSLYDILPRLSETSASTLLMRIPVFQNEEITFHTFPKNNCLEFRELQNFIVQDSELEINGGLIDEDEEIKLDSTNSFTKKFFTKHGWDFILMQKSGINNDNKRASAFYFQREIPLRKAEQANSNPAASNILFIDEYQPKDDPDQSLQHQQPYISPQKQTILKRSESQIDTDSKVNGNVLVSAYNYKKDFRLQYCMNNHTYSTNIESLFAASIDQVVQVMEQSDNIYNQNSLKELFHRKGLNLRFEWAVLSKLRQNTQRELLMIDILLRVMRRIINEEIKLKAISHTPVVNSDGVTNLEEYYQGNQLDQYKETVIFYMNTILKRKPQKNKSVFDETLLGLFLSRMKILGIVYSLNLSKEEFFYLESKDILEDIVDAPSKNPAQFVNSVMTYFKIEFKPEMLRIPRQDKHLFLSKSQPVQKTDIKLLQFEMHQFFTVREHTYLMLALKMYSHQSKSSPDRKVQSKIKTKSDKDKLKQSFQRPKEPTPSLIQISSRNRNQPGIGPTGLQVQDPSDSQETKTFRNQNQGIPESKGETLSTIRQYRNIDNALVNNSIDMPSQNSKQPTGSTQRGREEQVPLDFSKLSKRPKFKPTSVQEIILPSILYKLKTYLSQNPIYYFDDQSKTYVGDTLSVLRPYYEMPNLEVIDSWIIIIESLLQDVFTVNGNESVLLEALAYQSILTYFFKGDFEELTKVMQKIHEILGFSQAIAPETLLMVSLLFAIYFEEQKEQQQTQEAEKAYLSSLITIFLLYGDPRGRGNVSIPYTLLISWKLSILALTEDKKTHDSEFAEEIFDSALKGLFNHKRLYKEQQLVTKQTQPPSENEVKAQKFEREIERLEIQRQLFDIKKYRNRPNSVTYASGVPKSQTMYKKNLMLGSNPGNATDRQIKQEASVVYVSSNHHAMGKAAQQQANPSTLQVPQTPLSNAQAQQKQPQLLLQPGLDKKESVKSRSQIPMVKKKQNTKKQLGFNDYDLDPSEIDLEVEDENKNFFVQENFKNNEWYIGICPFQHWSIYRQQIQQIIQAHHVAIKDVKAQQAFQKETYKKMLREGLQKDVFYQWFIKFNPMMYQSGMVWSNQIIQELVFLKNQQMISSSSSSVVVSSHHLSSHQSLTSYGQQNTKERRNLHLGTYSQILGKEAGGISKQEMSGVIFSMGTDQCGQLGLDIISPQDSYVSLKVLYPRMIVSLRDEIIKEICCGHSHTMIINTYGQVFAWGQNSSGQLGLGDEAPNNVKRPVLNIYLQNITKLSAGNEHSLALTKNGELYIWGGAGLTGLGDMKQQNSPVRMEVFSKTKIVQAVCGGLHTIAVNKDGETYSWGSTEGGQLGLPQQQIIQLCQGKEIPVLQPQKISVLQGLQVIQIACGEAHSIAMCKDGTIYGWGMSNYGQLGLGFSSDSFEPGIGMEKSKVHEPQEIKGLKHERITRVICGGTFTLFQTEKGDLYGCGMNDLGQLGLDTFMEDLQVATLEKAKRGKHQQTSDVIVPTKVICFQSIALHNIACGENHALAVSGDDKNMLWAWGMFKNGQLGLGEVSMKMNPRPVQTLCSTQVQRISCGSMHSLALIGDSSQISTFSSQYYANNESIKNNWQCSLRGLCQREDQYMNDFQEDQVPDDGEGRVKNPK